MADWVRIVLAVVIVSVLIGLFILSYILNKRTPEPEGCRKASEECIGCAITGCGRNPVNHPEQNSMEEGKK